ncbi:MAG: hypothetical protein L0209_03485, partial [candidate division Zixibacteria bacterium]|nr:hypothetical protein [candidate division Zixibacteria bacterium]
MTLSAFSAGELELLVGLPYRVGVLISHAEDDEGNVDDEREKMTLESCLRGVAGLHTDEPLIRDIAQETLRRKDQWQEWAETDLTVEADARRAAALLFRKASLQEAKDYRAFVMEIAWTVARTYGEFTSFKEDKGSGVFNTLVGKIVGGFSSIARSDTGHPMNISAAEDSILSALSDALDPE